MPNGQIPVDARRREAEQRLRRAKLAIVSACAAITVAAWASIAGSVAAGTGSTSTPNVTAPADGGFFEAAPGLSDVGRQAPILRSGGS